MTEDGDGHACIDETANFSGSICGKNFRADVIDVERASDCFAGFAGVARHDHRFDLRIDEVLYGSASARAEAVLKTEHADEARADGDEHDGSSERFEFGDALFSGGDGDAIGEEQGATADAQVFTG